MKKTTLLAMLLALTSVTAFAQKITRAAGELVTPPATATVETWYTIDGNFYIIYPEPDGLVASQPNVNVAIDGTDIYIQGLAKWFRGWIKGTISGTTATFAGNQYVGEDEFGPEYICGSDDGKTLTETIVFHYDAEAGVLKAETKYILENNGVTTFSPYCFWLRPVFSKDPSPTTGISDISDSQQIGTTGYFNLSGQRLSVPRKGLNIVNGKKVLLK